MKIRAIIAAAALASTAAPAWALDPELRACTGFMQLHGYYEREKAYIDREVAIIKRMSPAEITLERGRICRISNKTYLLMDNMYEQVRICRDHNIPGMDWHAAQLATAVLDDKRKLKAMGCD